MKRVITKVLLIIIIIPSSTAGFVFEIIADTFGYGRRRAVDALNKAAGIENG